MDIIKLSRGKSKVIRYSNGPALEFEFPLNQRQFDVPVNVAALLVRDCGFEFILEEEKVSKGSKEK